MMVSAPQHLPLATVKRLSPLNPRQEQESDVSSLAATIRAVGLLHPILVRRIGGNIETYEVLAGGRRWRAMRLLQAERADALQIAATLFEGDETAAREAALAEATTQRPLHPVDEIIAFRDLAASGRSLAEIAGDFGEDERHVRRRLALAGLAPELLDLWRGGEIDRDIAAAFASGDGGAEAQRAALADELALPEAARWSPARIRRAVRGETVAAEEPLGRFFLEHPDRLSAYRALGGRDEESLFAPERRLLDRAIARRTAHGLLLRCAESVAAEEGFGAAYVMDDSLPEPLDLPADHTPPERARLAEIAAALMGADPDAAAALTAEREEIALRGQLRFVPAATRAGLGVACDIAADGGIEIIRFIPTAYHDDDRHDDEAAAAPPDAAAGPRPARERRKTAQEEERAPPPEPLPREAPETELVLGEAAERALRGRAAENVDIAMILAVAALGCSHGRAGVRLSADRVRCGPPRSALLEETRSRRFEAALARCAAAPVADLCGAFAELVAGAIDLRGETPALRDALLAAAANVAGMEAALIAALDHESYFRSLPREQIVDALRGIAGDAEANDAARLSSKSKLAARAAGIAAVRGYLPEALRRPLRAAASAPQSTAEAMVAAIAADEAAIAGRSEAIDAFLAERCRRGPDAGRVMASDLHTAFLGFAARRGAEGLGLAQFGAALTARGLQRKRAAKGIFYVELALKGAGDEEGKSDE